MNMKSVTLVAVVLATSLISSVSQAQAACNKTTVYGRIQTGYVFQDIGVMGTDEPVFQGGITRSCDSGWWFDLWNSTGLRTEGDYGQLDDRDYADEWDFTVAKNGKVETTLGAFQYEVFASYYALADLNSASDDIVELHADLVREFVLGTEDHHLSVSPYVRVMEFIGMGDIPNQTIVRPGLRVSFPFTGKLSLKTDIGIGFDPDADTNVHRTTTGLHYNFDGGLSGNIGVKTAEGVNPVALIGFSKTF